MGDTDVGSSSPDDNGGRRADLYEAIQRDGQWLAVGLIQLLHSAADTSQLNPTDFQCLLLLRIEGPMGPGQIAERLKLATGSVTGVIDRLERRGLAHRDRHPDDRRKVVAFPTTPPAQASPADAGALPGMREVMTRLHDDYSLEQLEIIADWLIRINRALTTLAEREHRT